MKSEANLLHIVSALDHYHNKRKQHIREDNQLQDLEFFLPLLPLEYTITLYIYSGIFPITNTHTYV